MFGTETGADKLASEPETRNLMLIDDEPAQQRLICALAGKAGWRTQVVNDGETAIATLGTQQGMRLDAIMLDQWVPGDDAMELIRELKARRPALPIIILTTSTSPQLAVDAMRAGATDYLVKPIAPERLLAALDFAVSPEGRRRELQPLSEKMAARPDFDAMIGSAPAFRAALAVAAKSARAHVPILIEGESGTGKEMIARALHSASPRSKLPLRIVNCAGFPAAQIESTLFGHEKGAFPGAFDRHIGLMQHADGGTIMIDGIECMPLPTQAKLMESMSRGDIQPLGAKHRFRVDVRIIAASDQSLKEAIAREEFREDLYYSLATVYLQLPPLRERAGDIPALVRHFLGHIGSQPGMRRLSITDEALQLLTTFDWPGNVRQLQNALFRAAIFCEGDSLTRNEFPQLAALIGELDRREQQANEGVGIVLYTSDGNLRPLEEIEADVIRLAIGHYRGRMTEVARRLGIGRSTLYRKLSELGIDNAA